MATIFEFPHRTVAEISIPALLKNLASLRAISQREVLPVLKADAYGHGMVAIGKALVQRGSVQMVCVATLEEGIEFRKKVSQSVGVLVLSGFWPHQVEAYLKYRLVPVIHNLVHLKALLGRAHLPELHLKLDTGMHRLGILPEEVPEACRVLQKLQVKLAGLMTHFAESELASSPFSNAQLESFFQLQEIFREKKVVATDARIHVANSGGILHKRLGNSTAVRPGISLYGIYPKPNWSGADFLVPVLSWRARVLCTKTLSKGESVGYGRSYKTKRRERLVVLPIGYADGYPRLLGNVGEVVTSGKRIPVRGRVSMDLTAADSSVISTQVREGMVVTLIGTQGDAHVSAWDVALWAQTIPYEILCGISPRVPRIYYE